jgi:hypothetical protein
MFRHSYIQFSLFPSFSSFFSFSHHPTFLSFSNLSFFSFYFLRYDIATRVNSVLASGMAKVKTVIFNLSTCRFSHLLPSTLPTLFIPFTLLLSISPTLLPKLSPPSFSLSPSFLPQQAKEIDASHSLTNRAIVLGERVIAFAKEVSKNMQ